ncbi:MAG: LysR family transcriptional regulator [Rhodobacteraceae bacterium]|nr:LysR family transcriptional regulator [Paracoccaceae bacterium]
MELRQIKYFRAVADFKSFTRAAVNCRVTQPALSRQISTLEEELGVELFIRDGRGAHLTPAGAEFYGRVSEVSDIVQGAIDAMRPYRSGKLSISVGVPPSLGPRFQSALARTLTQTTSDTELRLIEGYSSQLADWLTSGRLDVALLYGGIHHPQAEHVASMQEDLFLICPGQRKGAKRSIPFAELAQVPLISPDLPSTTRNEMERLARPLGVELNFGMQIDSVPAIKSIVADGGGYAILPHAAVEQEIDLGLLHTRDIIDPIPRLTLDLMVSTRSGLDRNIYGFCQSILAAMRDKIDSCDWKGARLITPSARG